MPALQVQPLQAKPEIFIQNPEVNRNFDWKFPQNFPKIYKEELPQKSPLLPWINCGWKSCLVARADQLSKLSCATQEMLPFEDQSQDAAAKEPNKAELIVAVARPLLFEDQSQAVF